MHVSFDKTYAPEYAVYGLGLSGLSVLEFCRKNKINVCCWDDDPVRLREASDAGYLVRDFSNGFQPSVRKVVISPGVPWNGQDKSHPAFRMAEKAKEQNIECICDIECLLNGEVTPSPALFHKNVLKFAVTGTNGKTSVVHWIEKIITLQEFSARAVGNNGVPALQSHADQDCLLFELSSYQLDLMHTAAFDRVMLLNISPDHLERYGKMEDYSKSKQQILDLLKFDSIGAVIGVDDPYCVDIADKADEAGIPVIRFSTERVIAGGIYLENGCVIDHRGSVPLVVLDPSDDPLLNNKQHMRNLTAVYAFLCRYPLEDFPRLATQAVREMEFDHRQNPVALVARKDSAEENAVINGDLFIDDSKATNPIAAADALRQFRHIHWIAGGQAKAGGFGDLNNCFDDLEGVYLIGSSALELQEYLARKKLPEGCKVSVCETLEAALECIALKFSSEAGSEIRTVLFSPGCASFDQFRNYVERGKAFSNGVLELGADAFDPKDEEALSLLGRIRRSVAEVSLEATAAETEVEAAEPENFLEKVKKMLPVKDERPSLSGGTLSGFLADWLVRVDKVSIVAIMLLFGFGLVVQAIADVYVKDISFLKQVFIGFVGLCGMLGISMFSRQIVTRFAGLAFIGSLLLMIVVLFFGIEIKGGTRWLAIPGLGFTLQPVEFFKVSAISVFALVQGYACNMGYSKTVRNLFSVGFIAVVASLIVAQPDFSQTALLVVALAVIALLASELSVWIVLAVGGLSVPAIIAGGYFLLDHVQKRIDDYWYRTYDATDQVGLAILTAEKAPWFSGIAEGGIRHWSYMSDVENDFVLVLMMQEFGKVIALFPVFLILLVLGRSLQRMWLGTDIALRFWQWGLVTLVAGQTFVNISTTTGLTPPTGMTLPLISYGGSSLLGIFFCFGILLCLGKDNMQKAGGVYE